MKRVCLFVLSIALIGCTPRTVGVQTVSRTSACGINGTAWSLEAPTRIRLGKTGTARIQVCTGLGGAPLMQWSTSDPTILKIVSQTATSAVIEGAGLGTASLTATGDRGTDTRTIIVE